jgi:hypothetical protein
MTEGSSVHSRGHEKLRRAVQLHRDGLIPEAKSIYQQLLLDDPENADAIGLLGMVAFQDGNREEAERSWRRSLDLPASPWVHIRDLNNLSATLLEDGRDEEAKRRLQSAEIPSWNEREGPDPRELKSIVSLTLLLLRFGLGTKARPLLESICGHLGGDQDVLRLLAQLRLDDKDFGAGIEALRKLEGQDDLWVLTARLKCAEELGLGAERRVDREKLLAFAPLHISESARADLPTILVVNSSEDPPVTGSTFDLHFHRNFPAQIANRLSDRFNFISAFPDALEARKAAPRPQLVLNNIVNAELLSGAGGENLKRDVSEFVESFGAPILNHPIRAAQATRQRMAFSLKGLKDVVAPNTMRFIARKSDIDFQVDALRTQLKYPLIIRTTTAQSGAAMVKLDGPTELRSELLMRDGREVYAHAFVENRGDFGLYRKFRAGIVGEKIIPFWVDFSDDWKVGGRLAPARKAFYRKRRFLREVERELMTVPNSVLTDHVLSALADIRERAPLDIFGIDFDVTADGKVLFFEANATMLL